MKERLLCLVLIYFVSMLCATAQFSKYIIRFTDKSGTAFSISRPLEFLSARAVERRQRQQIRLDETDLPLVQAYVDSILATGNVAVVNRSKWLNQLCIQTTDKGALAKIAALPFVLSATPLKRSAQKEQPRKYRETVFTESENHVENSSAAVLNYGNSYPQIHLHEGEYLHNKGFTGEGILIAVMDAGFYHYQTVTAFDSLRGNHQIKETFDFVDNEVTVNEDDPHGMFCLSVLAANWPGALVGSCPKANYYLYRTEDASTEFPIEEQNWVAAAERADSIGVDVFSTSLGYTTFDNPDFNHSYSDMNGNTTIIARGCDLAAKKGIISVVAAGNEGNSAWHYLSTPADADSCLSVGAVSSAGVVANFSSYGPSADGRVEPAVASVGYGTAIASVNNTPVYGNGTSFATPNMAGLVACLWQAFPDFTNMEIIGAVKKSSSIYNAPDNRIGYGIPNFHKAYDDLLQQRTLRNAAVILHGQWIKLYPNPANGDFNVVINPIKTGKGNISIYDNTGRLHFLKTAALTAGAVQVIPFSGLTGVATGSYLLRFDDGTNRETFKFIKK